MGEDNAPRVPNPGEFELREDETLPERYYQDVYELGGYEEGTKRRFWYLWSKFEEFLDKNDLTIDEVNTERRAREYCNFIDEYPTVNSKRAKGYVKEIADVYDYFNSKGYFGVNPFEGVVDNYNFKSVNRGHSSPFDSQMLDVGINEIAEGLMGVENPSKFITVMVLLKTGARRSEVSNLDMRDINLDHPGAGDLIHNRPPRREIEDEPGSIFIPSDVRQGYEYNGEVRDGGNKRQRDTIIPIDDELTQSLVYYLSCCPPSESPAKPLIRCHQEATTGIGNRKTPAGVSTTVRQWAEDNGWRVELDSSHDNDSRNISPHWFRHNFTTHMRTSVSKDDLDGDIEVMYYVKALRGDTGGDVIDTYTHIDEDWYRDAYLNNIYKLFYD